MRFFRLFGRREGKTLPLGDTGEQWQVGDLAECIQVGRWWDNGGLGPPTTEGPTNGEIHIVRDIEQEEHPFKGMITGLKFSPWPRPYTSVSFRKITPRADSAERADQSFIDDLTRRTIEPAPEPAEFEEAAHG